MRCIVSRVLENPQEWDVARPVWGRDDPADVIARCADGIRHHMTERYDLPPPTRDSAIRASQEIIAAKMAAGPRLELERKVREQAIVIDRLLAFVPSRARTLDSDRMQQIVHNLHEAAEELLGNRSIWSAILPETDEETFAAHRFVLTIECDPAEDMASFAASAFDLHRKLSQIVSRDEYMAIRLVIEPKPRPPREPV